MNTIEDSFRIRHFHEQVRPHDHIWYVRIESSHPDAHLALIHAFHFFVTAHLSNGVMYVEERVITDIREPMKKFLDRYFGQDVVVEVREDGNPSAA